ncbi:MAG TPA: hypothetical protein VJM46_03875 [Candidatus Saccharimonadales bacterium]|nr:hypothetical protein [Candidatus Saccharimonadales bacterium]
MTPEEETKSIQLNTDSPWQSSQNQPVVHVTPPTETPTPGYQLPKPKRTFKQKIGALLRSRKFWLLFIVGLIVIGLALWFVQPTRWWLVNAFGARNTLTITTIAPGEGKAKVSQLGNVAVTVDGKSYKTDAQGKLTVPSVPYGKVSVTAKKAGYQDVSYGVTLDQDPFLHKFGGQETDDAARKVELSLKATGIPVAFKVVDAFSGKPVNVGEFTIGDIVAKPDDQGLVSVKIPGTDDAKVTVSATFGGKYVDQKFDVALDDTATPNVKTMPEIKVVPGGKHYFVSKRDGKLTVYSSNLDGSDVQPIVAGTGQETDSIAFAVSPDGKYGVLSSSRDGARNSKQDMLQRIYVVDLTTKQITKVDEGYSVAFADWSGGTLVYTTTSYEATGNNYPTTLRSVDTSSKRVYNFETADSIIVGTVAFDKVVYQKYVNSGPDAAISPILRASPVNAASIKTLGEKTDYGAYLQLDFDRIAYKTGQDQAWHEYNLNTDQTKSIAQPSSGSNTIQYLSTAEGDGSKRLLIDRVDGKYTLFVKDMSNGAVAPLYGADGLGGPISWLGDVIIYRVVNSQETADYAISLNGGKPIKITDVTATASTQGAVTDNRFRFY